MIPLRDTVPRRIYPFVTLALIVTNVIIFFFELSLPLGDVESLFSRFGLAPARSAHPDGARAPGLSLAACWPFLTSLFLHGSWLHVVSNMWTLYLFGDNVEDLLGHTRFLIFYLLSGLAANGVHYLVNLDSPVPVIGASGAIAGIMAAYLRFFPRARIITLIPVLILPYFLELPAALFMAIWFIMQLSSGAASLSGAGAGGGIAWWAHIGGFVTGFLVIKPLCSKRLGGCYRDEWYLPLDQ